MIWASLGRSSRAYRKLTYDLRRLRLHRIVERIPHSHRCQLTADGIYLPRIASESQVSEDAQDVPRDSRCRETILLV
jgi:hypothetical protein